MKSHNAPVNQYISFPFSGCRMLTWYIELSNSMLMLWDCRCCMLEFEYIVRFLRCSLFELSPYICVRLRPTSNRKTFIVSTDVCRGFFLQYLKPRNLKTSSPARRIYVLKFQINRQIKIYLIQANFFVFYSILNIIFFFRPLVKSGRPSWESSCFQCA